MSLDASIRSLGKITGGAAVTTSDADNLPVFASGGLWIGTTGHVKVDTIDGSTITLNSVPVGLLDVYAKKVYATGTTASNIVALFSK